MQDLIQIISLSSAVRLSLVLQQKLKQKIDATANNDNNAAAAAAAAAAANADTVFQFDDGDHQPGGPTSSGVTSHGSSVSSSTNVGVTGGGQDGALPHLSVQIVQQFTSQRKSPQTIHTNVTVSSTLQPRFPPPPGNNPHHPPPDGSPAAQANSNINIHTTTSAQQQPNGASVSANTSTTANLGAGNSNSSSNNPAAAGVPGANAAHVSAETSVHTSIECKQEPVDDAQCRVTADSVSPAGVPDLPFDELQDILDSIEKDDEFAPNLIKELDDFDKIYHKVQTRAESNGGGADSSPSVFSSLDGCGSPGLSKATAPFNDPSQVSSQQQQQQQHASHAGAPPTALTPTMFETPQTMAGAGAGLPVRPPPSLVEPTGPAAETLKQMAAQHQHQVSAAPPFPSKALADNPYTDPYDPFGRGRNGYPPGYPSQAYPPSAGATGAAGYPGYGQSAGYGESAPPPLGQYPGGKPDLAAMGYSQTKPLTHYPTDGHGAPGAPPGSHGGQPSGPSSLQQLQNQVASHFSPMHITQTQHVQLAQGSHRMQLSQSQQVQMVQAAAAAAAQQQQLQQQQQQQQAPPPGGAPPGMTVSQQQSFNMASHMQGPGQGGQGQPPPGMGMAAAAREMQMMQEKMRREQQQQQQQYMNRPPPEYKMHPAARSAGPPYQPASTGGAHNGGGSSTPLQTMQNMVNQTPPYPTIKGEAGAGVMTQMSAVQTMAASVNTTGPHMGSTLAQSSQTMAAAYQHQQQQQQQQPPPMPQRPPSYSPHTPTPTPNGVATSSNGSGGGLGCVSNAGAHPHPASSSASSQAPSNYTSALMRNQRPPNVNVGPEGLNISQPRAHPGHPGHMGHPHGDGWPRPMMQGHPGQGHGHMQGQMGRAGAMGQSAMLPPGYAHRPGSAGSVAGMGGAGPMPGAPPGHPMMGGGMGMGVSGGTQVMMQQSVQMSQQQQQQQQQHGMAMRGGPGMAGHPQTAMPPHSAAYSGMVGPGAMQTLANGTHGQQYPAGLGQDDFMQFLSSEQSHNFDSLSSDLFDDILK